MSLSCTHCTFLNAAEMTMCEMCQSPLLDGKDIDSSLGSLGSVKSNKRTFNQTTSAPDDRSDSSLMDKMTAIEADIMLSCPRCTFNNPVSASICVVCEHSFDNQYPNSLHAQSSSSSRPSHGIDFRSTSDAKYHDEETSEVMQNGLIPLLERALRRQHESKQQQSSPQEFKKRRKFVPVSVSFRLCCPFTPHITQQGVEQGVHWSCGYRNIQMMCYTMQRMQVSQGGGDKGGIFGSGQEDVPDVAGLQCWIEKAWRAGFDPMGCQQLGGALLGTDEWIGATECAALLRFLGYRAQIVDFYTPKKPAQGKASNSTGTESANVAVADAAGSGAPPPVLSMPLVRWVKDYFDCRHSFLQSPLPFPYFGHSKATATGVHRCTERDCNLSSSSSSSGSSKDNNDGDVIYSSSQLPPLYFQHQGHSRTIVGYEQTSTKFSLLLFDPASSGRRLRVKFEQLEQTSGGWQCMVKRGAHTLTHGQYQIVYMAPGARLLPGTPAYENGKELRSVVYR